MKLKLVLFLIFVQIDLDVKKVLFGWFLGELNGKKGLFLVNYVERIVEEEVKF